MSVNSLITTRNQSARHFKSRKQSDLIQMGSVMDKVKKVSNRNSKSSQQVPEPLMYQQNYLNSNMGSMNSGFAGEYKHPATSQGLSLLSSKQNKHFKVVAVIVTFKHAGSYDDLFSTVQQKALEGTRVVVYTCDSNYLQSLIKAYEGNPQDQTARELMNYVKEVDPDCVVFNWECCSGYSQSVFPEGRQNLFKFLKVILDKGHFAMFSDFSLKALVKQWDEHQIGPNPFRQIGEHTGNFQIRFRNNDLKECPSAQLQIIGDMADKGFCNVNAAGGTIVYAVDQTKLKHDVYKLQMLTVVSSLPVKEDHLRSKIDAFEGAAGHVLLTYKSGGMILTSMGHWVALMQIDTSEKKLFQVAAKEYGEEVAVKMKAQYDMMGVAEQCNYISSNAKEFVRNQAPCSNMNRKAARKF